MENTENSNNDQLLVRDVELLKRYLAEAQERIKSLEEKIAADRDRVSLEVPPGGALGGYAKTIAEMNYKTLGEINNPSE